MISKPISYAIEKIEEIADSEFRLLVILGEHSDQSGKTENCEMPLDCMLKMPGWTRGRVIVASDNLRDNGAPIGVVGGFIMWRPAN